METKTKTKRSLALLISAVLGVLYAIYIVQYFIGGMAGSTESAEMIGAGIAAALVMPHMLCVVIAVIFNILGWIGNIRWAALVGAIMYAVAMIVFLIYAPFVLVQMILSFIGFARMKKKTPVA